MSMALKKSPDVEVTEHDESISGKKAKQLFNKDVQKKENKILTTFSIEPSFKRELEEMFSDMGLGWAAGIRFALKEFSKKHSDS